MDIGSPSAKKEASNGLPPCHGPKLYHFSRHDASITWIGRLDRHWENGRMDGEIKSHVLEAEIGGQRYAIKVFTDFDDGLMYMFGDDMVGDFDGDNPSCYTLPFHNECRAYGRLHEAKEAGTLTREIAVQCHGYIRLEDGDIQGLRRRRMPFDGDDVYGIVKDLTREDTGVNLNSIQRIWEDIVLINSLEIYIGNIREDSYRGGLLVDFCSAITEPHPRLVLEKKSVQSYDLDAWDKIHKNLVNM
ncbi:kinetochore Sim4 complex subunit Fta2 [Ilyonectria destructans]|nr:kinetochore Sim4 complex subunit Fta2 [Ilyonectria destructans]